MTFRILRNFFIETKSNEVNVVKGTVAEFISFYEKKECKHNWAVRVNVNVENAEVENIFRTEGIDIGFMLEESELKMFTKVKDKEKFIEGILNGKLYGI